MNYALFPLNVSGILGIVGLIDGSYIEMSCPAHAEANTYVNRHNKLSSTLPCVCGRDKKFLDVFAGKFSFSSHLNIFFWLHDFVSVTGCSNKIHNSTVFGYSDQSRKLPYSICGDEFHLLRDLAYTISPWLLTPSRNVGNITRGKQRFNSIFSATRTCVESANIL